MLEGTNAFLIARNQRLALRNDYGRAVREFRWPEPAAFNWALDYFDVVARGNDRTALWVVAEDGSETRVSYAGMAERSSRAAN